MATKYITINSYLEETAKTAGFEQYEFIYPSEINFNPDKYTMPLLIRVPTEFRYDVRQSNETFRFRFIAVSRLESYDKTIGFEGDYADRNTIWQTVTDLCQGFIGQINSDATDGNATQQIIIQDDDIKFIPDHLSIFDSLDVLVHFEFTAKLC